MAGSPLRQALARLGNASDLTLRLISLVFFLLVWTAAALLAKSTMLPGPWSVVQSMVDHIVAGDLPYHVGVTLARVAAAFVIAMNGTS